MNRPLRMLRYGTTAEQKYIDQFRDAFDVLMINGNMMAYAGNAMTKAVASRGHLEYVVDPLTHGFQHHLDLLQNEKGQFRASIRKMMEAYGPFILDKLNDQRIITPGDFGNEGQVEDFVGRVIRFQRDYITQSAGEKDYDKYLKFAEVQLKPKWLVIPYFYLNASSFHAWQRINLDLIKIAQQKFPYEQGLAVQLVIEQDLLDDREAIMDIAEGYVKAGTKRVLLWVDDFSAFRCPQRMLKNFVDLIGFFNESGVEVYNLYGDFFSILLCHPDLAKTVGLRGVCHGLEYGESRHVVPVGGGAFQSTNTIFPPCINDCLSAKLRRFFEVWVSLELTREIPGASLRRSVHAMNAIE